MTDQLDLLSYTAPEPEPPAPRAAIVSFMQAMRLTGVNPSLRQLARFVCGDGREGVLDDATAAAWRDLVAEGVIVLVDDPLDPDLPRWRLIDRDIKPDNHQELMVNRPLLLLLDANNLLHRIWHAPAREPVAERWGWSLNRWRRAVVPDFAVAVFDGDGPTWRHEVYPPYKAKRDDDPSKRPSATDWRDAKLECDAAGLRWVQVAGVEADDMIASYVAAAMLIQVDVTIVSGDKDLMQLLRDRPNVRQIDPGSGQSMGPADVCERWGVEPNMLADLLAVAGDTSDNYPGVRGIGAKGAAKLINTNGGVDQILDRVNLLPTKLAAKLRAQADEARLFRKLAGLVDDLPLPVSITSATW